MKKWINRAALVVGGLCYLGGDALAGRHYEETPIDIYVFQDWTIVQGTLKGVHNLGSQYDTIGCYFQTFGNSQRYHMLCGGVLVRPDGSSWQPSCISSAPVHAQALAVMDEHSSVEFWVNNNTGICDTINVSKSSGYYGTAAAPPQAPAACLDDWQSTTAGQTCFAPQLQSDHRDGCQNLLNCWETNQCDQATCSQSPDDICGQNKVSNYTVGLSHATSVYSTLCN